MHKSSLFIQDYTNIFKLSYRRIQNLCIKFNVLQEKHHFKYEIECVEHDIIRDTREALKNPFVFTIKYLSHNLWFKKFTLSR